VIFGKGGGKEGAFAAGCGCCCCPAAPGAEEGAGGAAAAAASREALEEWVWLPEAEEEAETS
jgi:hypothetical protein